MYLVYLTIDTRDLQILDLSARPDECAHLCDLGGLAHHSSQHTNRSE